jgi:hypothetical protein
VQGGGGRGGLRVAGGGGWQCGVPECEVQDGSAPDLTRSKNESTYQSFASCHAAVVHAAPSPCATPTPSPRRQRLACALPGPFPSPPSRAPSARSSQQQLASRSWQQRWLRITLSRTRCG